MQMQSTWYAEDTRSLGTYDTIDFYPNILKPFVLIHGWYPKSSTWIISKPEKGLACVTGLRFALVRVILAVLFWMTSPKFIGCRIAH